MPDSSRAAPDYEQTSDIYQAPSGDWVMYLYRCRDVVGVTLPFRYRLVFTGCVWPGLASGGARVGRCAFNASPLGGKAGGRLHLAPSTQVLNASALPALAEKGRMLHSDVTRLQAAEWQFRWNGEAQHLYDAIRETLAQIERAMEAARMPGSLDDALVNGPGWEQACRGRISQEALLRERK